jgi:D-alanyl-lipoteichoic acid acyltransferase DltB (MBOAT superfamily)
MTHKPETKRPLLLLGLIFNISLLGYFKYAGFFIANTSAIVGFDYTFERLALPLAISFFTLQQIAFLVDNYEGSAKPGNFINYATFVVFFPQLIAGPIVHHREVMPQFESTENKRLNYDNIAKGIAYFSIGLFKKTVIADTFAQLADNGFSAPGQLSAVESLIAILSYTFQLYYDFGGYMDMAIGAALFFNISLPINFNSPFKSTSIIDFWRRWHITLSNFITTYLYTPMVRAWAPFTVTKSLAAIGLTMLIAGLWHGAAWTFIVFGGLHGGALILNHVWRRSGRKMPNVLGVTLTFSLTALSLCFFRASSITDALRMLLDLLGINGILSSLWLNGPLTLFLNIKNSILFNGMGSFDMIVGTLLTTGAAIWAFTMPNTHETLTPFKSNWRKVFLCVICLCASLLYMNSFAEKEFLYFDF